MYYNAIYFCRSEKENAGVSGTAVIGANIPQEGKGSERILRWCTWIGGFSSRHDKDFLVRRSCLAGISMRKCLYIFMKMNEHPSAVCP